MSDDTPKTDHRDPADVVDDAVAHTLRLARTWTAWDGVPITASGREFTPHKAIRRVADHLLDHLAELEARLAGATPLPDHWHASSITTPADFAAFTPEDLDEATSRLTRLAQLWRVRLRALDDDRLDQVEGEAWSLRQVAFHVAESADYADFVGDLGTRNVR